ncbi:MAG: serine hydrolase [Planctomycetota bacterium]|nr:serine hydrolase [Planctomycetota bacterium]
MTQDCVEFLEDAIDRRVFPGASFSAYHKGQLHTHINVGTLAYESSAAVTSDTLYDIASVTKVVSTTASIAALIAAKKLCLEDPLKSYFPEFAEHFLGDAQLKHLLAHCSGLPSTWPMRFEFEAGTPRQVLIDHLLTRDFSSVPSYIGAARTITERHRRALQPGSNSEYSDLGMIILGLMVERVSGCSQRDYFKRAVAEPLGLSQTLYCPNPEACAPTGKDVPGRGTIQGQVHDSKAWLLGNVAGHAGLFSTASNLARFGEVARTGQHKDWPAAERLRSFGERVGFVQDAHWGIGWKTNLKGRLAPGTKFSERCFGHDGFTGAFLWIDPSRELTMSFVTNRVYPQTPKDRSASADIILEVRRGLMERVLETLSV